jgi:glutamine amidotransferase
MITIIDYGLGNIQAFRNVYKRLNLATKIAKVDDDLIDVERIILPGVGAFDYAMTLLNSSGMRERLEELVLKKRVPVLGVCVGMQMMGNKSDEGNLDGLKWIDAEILKFDSELIQQRTKLPHMGWNDVFSNSNHPLFKGLDQEAVFYFLHSYYFKSNSEDNIIATSEYGISFPSAVNHENIFGVQFHPEKSHKNGEILLSNFANL